MVSPASEQPCASDVWARRLRAAGEFSCAKGWGPGQALEGFWRDVFSSLRPGSRILEIGCGSGDVSIWAAEAGRSLRIVASDRVALVGRLPHHPAVEFLGDAPAEALPVESASFDAVISNFGIEYADHAKAAAELARVLKPAGGGMLVLHSADSTVTAMSRAALGTHQRLIAADVPDRVRSAAALRPDHLSRRKLLKDVLRREPEIPPPALSYSGVEYFEIARRLLKGDPAARRDLETLDEAVTMRQQISREQSRVALDRTALGALQRLFQANGLVLEVSELTYTYPSGLTDKVGWIGLVSKTVVS